MCGSGAGVVGVAAAAFAHVVVSASENEKSCACCSVCLESCESITTSRPCMLNRLLRVWCACVRVCVWVRCVARVVSIPQTFAQLARVYVEDTSIYYTHVASQLAALWSQGMCGNNAKHPGK